MNTAGAAILAGDYLNFCATGGAATNVQISLFDSISNTALGTSTAMFAISGVRA